ncbi:acyl-CoA Delta-9 desaturase-like isoform X2 [Daphnia pulex]|uniref:acyl-CoA Delta-9 desaturase-like isoform X2 n=1 Tax=Daphnia pulex TaxID=6669 RepID=UPI001EE0C17B|nr:acyl-CoA Delta-9 desaturase-like isoform X2 [Daphnia pulex]
MENSKSKSALQPTSVSGDEVTSMPYTMEIVWSKVVFYIYLHLTALYGFYLCFTSAALTATLIWAGGAHKLWCHRAFKANLPLRVLIAVAQTVAHQGDIYTWSWEHRVHHKFSDTDADPYNSRRGFFFSHIGWMMCQKHPEFTRMEKTIDVGDLLQDPVVVFQRKYYTSLAWMLCYAMPAAVPWYFWGESLTTAFFVASMFRYVFTLHATWLTNSAGHSWGKRPYDKQINPSDSLLAASFSLGEWHNYHHAFPGDYRVAELGSSRTSFHVVVIDFFAWLGLVYDRKTVRGKVVRGRVLRTGDGTHSFALKDCPFNSGDIKDHSVVDDEI